MASIPITQLSFIPLPVTGSDLLAIVQTSSMTTYKVNVFDVISSYPFPQLVSASLFSSRSLFASQSIWAVSASWASRSLFSEISSQSLFSVSASWASRSLVANSAFYSSASKESMYSTYSLYANLTGSENYFPYWYTDKTLDGGNFQVNGGLQKNSLLYNYPAGAGAGTVIFAPDPTLNPASTIPGFPGYSQAGWWNPSAVAWDGEIWFGGAGIFTALPIVSTVFNGTDQKKWPFATASNAVFSNQYWQGNYNGGPQTIGSASDSIATAFNGKWVRIATLGVREGPVVVANASKGEVKMLDTGLKGRVRIKIADGGNKNYGVVGFYQDIDMHLDASGNIPLATNATIFAVVQDGWDVIRKLRISVDGSGNNDPMFALDIFINDIPDGVYGFYIECQSWGGVRFLETPNISPIALVDADTDPLFPKYLIFPPAPGHYSNRPFDTGQPYVIGGQNVIINPKVNEITESAGYGHTNLINPYSLDVSGSINTQQYYAKGQAGLNANYVAYHPSDSKWYNLEITGGIPVKATETTSPVAGPTGPTIIAAGNATCQRDIAPTENYKYGCSITRIDNQNIGVTGGFPSSYAVTALARNSAGTAATGCRINDQGPTGFTISLGNSIEDGFNPTVIQFIAVGGG